MLPLSAAACPAREAARDPCFFIGNILRPTRFFPFLWHSVCTMPGMTFRITKTTAGTVTALRIDGQLKGEGVAELEEACASVDGPVDLDLSQLITADAEGVRALKNVLSSGARLVAASLFVELLLKKEEA